MPLSIVVLAAGEGKRMRSRLPKVLHPIGGRPMLAHVLGTARRLLGASEGRLIVVHGHGGEVIQAAFAEAEDVVWVEQSIRRGTGDAVAQAMPWVGLRDTVLVLYGDVPLVGADTLHRLIAAVPPEGLAVATTRLANPTGYGRILREESGRVIGIREERDAGDWERAINEVNTGLMAADARFWQTYLPRLEANNRQGELYLTDCVGLAASDGHEVAVTELADPGEAAGVNDRIQLAALEHRFQLQERAALMQAGATLLAPDRVLIRGEVTVGMDVLIDADVILAGHVQLADGVVIGQGCVLCDVAIAEGATVEPYSLVEGARLGPGARVGPFARLRPGTELQREARVGNFVEVKNATLGERTKANHLSYLGDACIGADTNVGAGTITCNYDGRRKHRTEIGDQVFIGSNTALVAPLTVAAGATVGAGSTVTRTVPPGALVVARARERLIEGWRERRAQAGPSAEGGAEAGQGPDGPGDSAKG